ncbi:Enhancer of polycomb-like protein 1 [Coniochaeta pulveracea]|uniref:Enhancer of polycomb-like protein n=1 Tax=Coniochaeta pulveracea TaxID=177199 RepID=A0A420Y242_9PEZI|nr:Enhancer of polycomb-like protein 1 [Coniochaeta pulveracea]
MATRKVRHKKLSVKTILPILREDELDSAEYEAITTETQLATGVEQAEENEVHLQSILKGAGVSSSNEIPVPPPQSSSLSYDELYATPFQEPNSYLRFSQTVEECIGCTYDMTEEDDAFLKSYNQKRPPSAQLSEDDFERILEVYEDTAYDKAPYAAIDQTIVPYEEMIAGLHQLHDSKLMQHAKELYEYWKSRRVALGNRSLHPSLKFETHQESDEGDPYVCFRRREVRQTRKTRQRDAQSAEKLKRLRKELEDGRQLISASHRRELLKKEMLMTDRRIFEMRAQLKEVKVRLKIRTDDEDLINQKPQKRKAVEPPAARPPPPKEQRLNPVNNAVSRPSEFDLPQLADILQQRENELRRDIETKIQNHIGWNKDHVDLTRDPLPPVRGKTPEPSFRPAKTQYLLTPPASASNESMEEPVAMDLDKPAGKPHLYGFRGVAHDENPASQAPSYRRRIGRLNRLWIDRRGLASPPLDADESSVDAISDRWKYDQDSDEEGEQPMYEVDPFDTQALFYRAYQIGIPMQMAKPRPQPGLPPGITPEMVAQLRHGLAPPQQQGRPQQLLQHPQQQLQQQQPQPPAAAS